MSKILFLFLGLLENVAPNLIFKGIGFEPGNKELLERIKTYYDRIKTNQ